jgi:hypothetical protein
LSAATARQSDALSAATARWWSRPTRRRPAEVSSLRHDRLTLLDLPPIPRLRTTLTTVQASLAGSRAPPGDRKPEQTLCRLRRRDNQTLCRLRRRESQQAGAIVAHLQRCKHRLRGAGRRPATVSRSRRCVGCDGAIISRMALRA